MIQVYVGEGKGKTTSAIGLSIRAAGHGYKVLFMQFLKDDSSGEISILKSIPSIEVIHSPVDYGFIFQMTEDQKKEAAQKYDEMLDIAIAADVFLIVLDEVIHGLNAGMVDRNKIEKLMNKDCEIVLTGRDAPEWIIDCADYISNVQKVKHPYDKGIQAREGIEF